MKGKSIDASAPARALERFLCHVIVHMPSYLAAVKHTGVNSHLCGVIRSPTTNPKTLRCRAAALSLLSTHNTSPRSVC